MSDSSYPTIMELYEEWCPPDDGRYTPEWFGGAYDFMEFLIERLSSPTTKKEG